jgi:hypothetical protein
MSWAYGQRNRDRAVHITMVQSRRGSRKSSADVKCSNTGSDSRQGAKYAKRRVIPSARQCEKSVHGSTELTTNGIASFETRHLAVRPERRRRAPIEFSHSLAHARDLRKISPLGRNANPFSFAALASLRQIVRVSVAASHSLMNRLGDHVRVEPTSRHLTIRSQTIFVTIHPGPKRKI